MSADVVSSGREHPAVPRRSALLAVALLGAAGLTALVVAEAVRDRRAREATVALAVTAADRPRPATAGASDVQDVVVDLTVHNTGGTDVVLLDQRLDGGGPVDRVPEGALAAGASAVLAVRWRVLCAEVGSLSGPVALDLTARAPRGGDQRVVLPLQPEARRTFRLAASRACAA